MTLVRAAVVALALCVCGCATTLPHEQIFSSAADSKPDKVGRGNLHTICAMGVQEACDVLENPLIVAKFTTAELKSACLGGNVASCRELMKAPPPNNAMGAIGTLKP